MEDLDDDMAEEEEDGGGFRERRTTVTYRVGEPLFSYLLLII
jgi:hypothetical protein